MNKKISIIFISLLGIIVYSNTFRGAFHFDDNLSIVSNSFIKNLYNLQNIWNFWPSRFITYFSIALNYHFNQLDVFGYHLFNLGVHLVTAILVWWLTFLTLSTPAMNENKIAKHANLVALLAGLVFVSHPVQTEAVTYIVQRAASMAALFYVASLCFYIKSRLLQDHKSSSGFRKFYYFSSLLTAILAMFTKEMAITLPVMIVLYEFSFFRMSRSFNWKSFVPFLFVLLVIPLTIFITKSVNVQGMHRVTEGASGISSLHYLLTQFRVMLTYIRLVFLPLNQHLDYDYPIYGSIFALPVLLSFASLIIIFFSAIRLFSQYRLISFSILWFFLTLLPESSFLPIKDVIYEHRLYLPMVGYSIFLVSSIYYLLRKSTIKTIVIVLLVIITCNSILTYQRNKVWRSEFTLWDDSVRKSPHKERPYVNRGTSYAAQGDFIQAMLDYKKAIAIDPNYADAYYNLGNIYKDQGKFSQAIFDYNKAIKINPQNAQAYNNRGIVWYNQGNFAQAIADFTQAVEINPDDTGVYFDRGNVYFQKNKMTQAMSDYSKVIEINPEIPQVYNNRAVVYYRLKNYDKAWADVRKAEKLGVVVNPNFISVLKSESGKNE